MNFFIQLHEITLYAALLVVIYYCLTAVHARKSKKEGTRPPEAAGSWPIIGHLHLLGGENKLLHKILGGLADMHGPIFTIRLGIRQAAEVSNWEVAKECFTTNDRVFSQRPKSLAGKIIGYDHAMFGLAPYGKYWRDMRKIATVHLLSNHRLELFKPVWSSEIKFFIQKLYEQSVKNGGRDTVEMTGMFGDLAMSIMVRMLAGKQFSYDRATGGEESRHIRKALGDFLYQMGLFFASDTVPFLGWLDFVKGHVGEMKRTAKELDRAFSGWVNEHRKKRLGGIIKEDEMDFIDVMLSLLDDSNILADDPDTVIKSTCLV
uniref:Uncharacterized protein MANES_17G096500 n=2 Tax=Rhizophora mucronata TaxID=61149 RepID=A0A2P2JHT3_RHIMU